MIQNRSTNRREDYFYISGLQKWKKSNIIYYIGESLIGICIIYECFPLLKLMLLYHMPLSIKNLFLLIVSLLFAAICLCMPWVSSYTGASRAYKNYDKNSFQDFFFMSEEVVIRAFQNGVTTEQHLSYSIIEKYIYKNHAVYIGLRVNKTLAYYVVQDSGYMQGSAGELIALLESKGIHGRVG